MPAKAVGVEVITNPTVPTGMLIFPSSGMDEVDFYAEGGNFRWTDDVTETISTTVGTLLADGNVLEYRGDYRKIKFITTTGTGTLRCHKYQRTTAW